MISSDYSLKDKYSILSYSQIIKLEKKLGIKFSRRILINKQAIHNDEKLKLFLNELLKDIIINYKSNMFKGKAIILINNILRGTNAFQNIYYNSDLIFFGANTFIDTHLSSKKNLITFGLAGCVLLLLKSKNNKHNSICYHFSTNQYFEKVMLYDVKNRMKNKNKFDAYLITFKPEYYINILKTYTNIHNLFFCKKEKSDVYDIIINDDFEFRYSLNKRRFLNLSSNKIELENKIKFTKHSL